MNNLVAGKSVQLAEWQTCHLEGAMLRPEDRPLAESIGGSAAARLGLDELRSGLRISARSWVGVVRFSDFELRVIPKLAGGDVGLLRLVDFASGINALDRHPAIHTFEAEGASLFDLVALLLAEACEKIIRSGLLIDYQEVEDDLPVVRGRLLVREQALRRFGRVDRLECRYDEHTSDTMENRLLLAALAIAAPRVSHPSIALRLRRLQGILSETCMLEGFDLRITRSALVYNRLNEHYREGHGLAWLILDGLGVEDLYSGGGHRTFAFLLDMNRLFEDFITRWLTQLLKATPFRAIAQRRDRTILWNADFDRPYAGIIPDILIERKDRIDHFLPLDAKYKLYDNKPVAVSDICQTFMYAYAYGRHHSELPGALLLYPSTSPGIPAQMLHVRQAGIGPSAQITAMGLHLPTALLEATSGMIGPTGKELVVRFEAALGH